MTMKPKENKAGESGAGYDKCYTPWHGIAPLFPYLPAHSRIWECAAGSGMLADALDAQGHTTIRTDYQTGHDFFQYDLDPAAYDVIVTNPPYSLKYKWLKRCYATGKPFALLVPFETLTAGTALKLYREYGWEELRLTQRINFYMPGTGFHNNGAQFSTVWLCYKLLPAPIMVATLPEPLPHQRLIRPKKAKAVNTEATLFDLV